MYQYTPMEWVMFFYLYCFLGWCWESAYVSVKSKKWCNRGFMHGPFLPIYGSGAIIILLATIPVKTWPIAVFFFGMIAATVLEYCTGEAMLRLFHVRYWDYSKRFMNLNGHICLKCSLVWGAFSMLMIYVIHVPIESAVLSVPRNVLESVTYAMTLLLAADFTISFREAMDFRRMLENVAANSEELKRLMKRMEVVSAFAEADLEEFKEGVEERAKQTRELLELTRDELEYRIENTKERVNADIANTKEKVNADIANTKEKVNADIANTKQKVNADIESVKEKINKEVENSKRVSLEDEKSSKSNKLPENEGIEKYKDNLSELMDTLSDRIRELHSKRENIHNTHEYKGVRGIMRRNTIGVDKKYEQALKHLLEVGQDRNNLDNKNR